MLVYVCAPIPLYAQRTDGPMVYRVHTHYKLLDWRRRRHYGLEMDTPHFCRRCVVDCRCRGGIKEEAVVAQ